MSLRRVVVERILDDHRDGDVDAAFAAFSESTAIERERLGRLVSLLRKDGVSDTAAVVVALRQMMKLAGSR